ncbi:sarcosine oxidase subunit gamma [Nereida sp. MMG025]|uniref:sarcosine oxidase subunit gamma n=1 Tax=Nereida sp. MMG025 TaxID=2909981 RepID=UPI001F20A3D5|nr:sarcosine oxidase subunit gamma [Nereida sp. MMG025]MCF6445132.1 sarcosine oxidase subunit gamma [Nereida sp. MMG025]
MVKLVAQTPCHGLLPISLGDISLTEVTPQAIFSYAPFAGQTRGASEALKTHHGVAMPRPGRVATKEDVTAMWFGQDQVLVLGARADAGLATFGAVTDQSDAWAIVELHGAATLDILARLTPVDVAAMRTNDTARSLIQHMSASLTRLAEDRFQLVVMRSMARTLVHDLTMAATGLAARQKIIQE